MSEARRSSLAMPFALLTALLLTGCSGFGIKGDLAYGQFDISGDVALSPSVGNIGLGTLQADIQNDFGLDEKMETPYARLEAAVGIASFTFSGFQVDQTGRGTLSTSFGDIPVGAVIDTELEISNLKGAVFFDLLNLGVVRLAPGVGVDLFDMNLRSTAISPITLTEELDALAPVPMVFAQAEVDLGSVEAVLDVGGMQAKIEDADGTFIDIELLARLVPIENLELVAGYRYILMDVEGNSEGQAFLGDLALQGWYVGGGIRF